MCDSHAVRVYVFVNIRKRANNGCLLIKANAFAISHRARMAHCMRFQSEEDSTGFLKNKEELYSSPALSVLIPIAIGSKINDHREYHDGDRQGGPLTTIVLDDNTIPKCRQWHEEKSNNRP